jgi:branched-chain amino acid transport system substrate-binding protein
MPPPISRRTAPGAGLDFGALTAAAKTQTKPIRIGVLTDLTGAYSANTGQGSIVGAQLAVEEFTRANPDIPVDVVAADSLSKPDAAMGIAGTWIDTQGVDVITDGPLSSAAFPTSDLVRRKDKIAIFTGGASSDLTGTRCGPNHLHWAYDTWSMPHAAVDATVKDGSDTWFFITSDYAFGHQLQKDASDFVVAANGKVLGYALVPFPGTTDFASFLIQAKASGAKAIGLANSGGDTVNCIKQAAEFGIQQGGQKVVGLLMRIHDVHGVGLSDAQGVLLTEPFYWDLNDGTRAFAKRFIPRMNGSVPGSVHAGQYSAVTHYLKAVRQVGYDKAKASGRTVIEAMKAMPTHDIVFGDGMIRPDGRVIHNMYLFEVKTPEQSTGPWDYYRLKQTVPAAQAFRPIDQGGCPMVRA